MGFVNNFLWKKQLQKQKFCVTILWYVYSVLNFSCFSYLKNYNLLIYGFDKNRNFIMKSHMNLLEKNKSVILVSIIFSIFYFVGLVVLLMYVKISVKLLRINRNEDFSIELRRMD